VKGWSATSTRRPGVSAEPLEGGKEPMKNLRVAVGVALASSVVLILVSGFVAHSTREVVLVLLGFGSGLAAVYLLERLKARRAR